MPPRAGHVDLTDTVIEGDCNLGELVVTGVAAFRGTTFRGHVNLYRAVFRGGTTFRDSTFAESADFAKAAFSLAWFSGARFAGGADFSEATWTEEAVFEGVRFEQFADFAGARCTAASFAGATFAAGASFYETTFDGVTFESAEFDGEASFERAEFAERCAFDSATFERGAHFERCRFGCRASFGDGAGFGGVAAFDEASFTATAWFVEAVFGGPASFARTKFSDLAVFADATFAANVSFSSADLAADLDLAGARVSGSTTFRRARFRDVRRVGPMVLDGELSLALATFDEIVRIEAIAPAITADGAVFRAGVDLLVRGAEITVEGADFGGASLISTLDAAVGDEPEATGAVRVRSLRNAKVARLTLSCVDLRACRFAGAHGLDGLRLDRVRLLRPPRRRRGIRWTQRDTILEEHLWRSAACHGSGWTGPVPNDDEAGPGDGAQLQPPQIASIYRSLRKAREDAKDEPGAADFYYGEMEMRRHSDDAAADGGPGSRLLLTLYWLVSGYGLRASRALTMLALTVAGMAALLAWWGFDPSRGYGSSLLFAVQSSIGLLRAPDAKLSAGGEVVQIALRIAGPLFFGLAVLALRSRVKR